MPISSGDDTRVVVRVSAGNLVGCRAEVTVSPKSLLLCFQVVRYRSVR